MGGIGYRVNMELDVFESYHFGRGGESVPDDIGNRKVEWTSKSGSIDYKHIWKYP